MIRDACDLASLGLTPFFEATSTISKPETVQIQTLQHVQVALVPKVLARDGTVYGNRQIIRVRRGAHQVLAVACLVRFKPKKSGSIKNTEYIAVTLEGKALDVPWTEVEDHHVSVSDLAPERFALAQDAPKPHKKVVRNFMCNVSVMCPGRA